MIVFKVSPAILRFYINIDNYSTNLCKKWIGMGNIFSTLLTFCYFHNPFYRFIGYF